MLETAPYSSVVIVDQGLRMPNAELRGAPQVIVGPEFAPAPAATPAPATTPTFFAPKQDRN
jgi:hypothetical protein